MVCGWCDLVVRGTMGAAFRAASRTSLNRNARNKEPLSAAVVLVPMYGSTALAV